MKNRLTYEEHNRLGREIQIIYDYITNFSIIIGNTYRKKDNVVQKAVTFYRDIMKLKSELDEVVCREFPFEREPPPETVYYRANEMREEVANSPEFTIRNLSFCWKAIEEEPRTKEDRENLDRIRDSRLLDLSSKYEGTIVLRGESYKSKQGGWYIDVFCPWCDAYHTHSYWEPGVVKRGNIEGHRAAHCFREDSPLRQSGYYIGELPKRK